VDLSPTPLALFVGDVRAADVPGLAGGPLEVLLLVVILGVVTAAATALLVRALGELTEDGGLWVLDHWEGLDDQPDRSSLSLLDGSEWSRYDAPEGTIFWAGVAPDDTVWVRLYRSTDGSGPKVLAHFDGSPWTEYAMEDIIPPVSRHFGGGLGGGLGEAHFAPDGSLWVRVTDDALGYDCLGVANFDGSSWTTYLEDQCVYAMDVGIDGSVWLYAATWQDGGTFEDFAVPDDGMTIHTYVISLEAVAATE
jgi:hypothetical protein